MRGAQVLSGVEVLSVKGEAVGGGEEVLSGEVLSFKGEEDLRGDGRKF